MEQRTINITQFKAKCLALLEDVGQHGGTITITKRGCPLATVGPARSMAWKSPEGLLAGKGFINDDLLDRDHADLWDVVSESPRK
jgi:antitoxin (DNA-binding transcriptional repressor) of toxin-antitoxin stability system